MRGSSTILMPHMSNISRLGGLAALLSGCTLAAQSEPTLHAYSEVALGGAARVHTVVEDATGPAFAVAARVQRPGAPWIYVAAGSLDIDGNGQASALVQDPSSLNLDAPVELSVVYMGSEGLTQTAPASFVFGAQPICETLDFDFTIGDDSGFVAGRIVDNQYDAVGITISAVNDSAFGPDTAILFDSSNPTGEDPDLATPNMNGQNNTTALGNLLIIAEDVVDADMDTLVDDPDDEREGGSLIFDFRIATTVCSATVVDIDDAPGSELRFYRNGDLTTPSSTIPLVSLGDGSVQRVDFMEMEVERFEVYFQGSGALANVDLDVCPELTSPEEFTLGEPRNLPAGLEITGSTFPEIASVQGLSTNPASPDKVILFDTQNPTGGDFDLITPNPMNASNNVPLGKVFILAENDVDADMDGLVDDPDDDQGGGIIRIEFATDVTFFSVMVLDVDETRGDFVRLFDSSNTLLSSTFIPDQPDGSVQLVEPDPNGVPGVRYLELDLAGSGALTRIFACPEILNN